MQKTISALFSSLAPLYCSGIYEMASNASAQTIANISEQTTTIHVRCSKGSAQIEILSANPTLPPQHRFIELSTVPITAQPRLLALAIFEMLTARQPTSRAAARSAPDQATPGPKSATIVKPRVPPTATPRWTYQLGLLAGGTLFSAGAGSLWGAGVQYTQQHRSHFGFMVDFQTRYDGATVTLGHIATTMLGGSVAATYDYPFWRRLSLLAGPGARFGAVYFLGTPLQNVYGDSGWSYWGGPLVVFQIRVQLLKPLSVLFNSELGYAALSAQALAAKKNEVNLQDVWFSANLGVAYQF